MDTSEAHTYDAYKKLQEAMAACNTACDIACNDSYPWTDVDHWISVALARLHVARVDMAAARAAHERAWHDATVAKNYDTQPEVTEQLGDDDPNMDEIMRKTAPDEPLDE